MATYTYRRSDGRVNNAKGDGEYREKGCKVHDGMREGSKCGGWERKSRATGAL